jgi:hypothetical protein
MKVDLTPRELEIVYNALNDHAEMCIQLGESLAADDDNGEDAESARAWSREGRATDDLIFRLHNLEHAKDTNT